MKRITLILLLCYPSSAQPIEAVSRTGYRVIEGEVEEVRLNPPVRVLIDSGYMRLYLAQETMTLVVIHKDGPYFTDESTVTFFHVVDDVGEEFYIGYGLYRDEGYPLHLLGIYKGANTVLVYRLEFL